MKVSMKQEQSRPRTVEDLLRMYDLAAIVGLKRAAKLSAEGLNRVNATMEEFIVAILGDIENIQNQIDGNVTTWFQEGEPNLDNYPANEWLTDEVRNAHLGDMYYDKDTGYGYRFIVDDGQYEWFKLTDSDVVEALAIANAAQDTADGKRRVFVLKPTPPYDEGDLWLRDKEIYVCAVTKDTNGAYVEGDFVIATKYTDDTLAKEVEAGLIAAVTRISYLEVNSLTADSAVIKELQTNSLTADSAIIQELILNSLTADSAIIQELQANSLTASSAVITELQSDVAEIDTLLFGSAGGTVIQTEFSNAVIAQLGTAQIKSAMIEDITADKITGLDLNTSRFTVHSEDGLSVWRDNTIQISDGTRVRVQIGKDASDDYSLNVWDESGNLMFSQGGITDSAIKDAIIRNDMVSETANISASKLDIDSLFEEINGSTNTIKSTKVYLDDEGQTLDLAFTNMSTSVTALESTQISQGTEISTIQGQINSKIWQTDITAAVDGIVVGGRNLALSSNETKTIALGGGFAYITYDLSEYGVDNLSIDQKVVISFDVYADSETAVDSYIRGSAGSVCGIPESQTVETTAKRLTFVVTITKDDPLTVAVRGNDRVTGWVAANIYISNIKVELGNKATDWTPAPEDIDSELTELSTRYSDINQTVGEISTKVGSHDTVIDDLGTRVSSTETNYTQLDDKFNWIVESGTSSSDFTITDRMASLTAEYINLNGSVTFSGLDADTQSSITTASSTADSALSSATSANNKIDGLEVGGRNLLSDTGENVTVRNGTFTYAITDYGKLNLRYGKNVTVSFEAKSDVITNVDTYPRYLNDSGVETGGMAIGKVISLTTEWTRHVAIFNLPYNAEYVKWTIRSNGNVSGGSTTATVNIRNIKLELGNKSTDWTPAPEDVDNSIAAVKTMASENALAMAAWCYENDKTLIDGKYIYTGTINVQELFSREITATDLHITGNSTLTDVTATGITIDGGSVILRPSNLEEVLFGVYAQGTRDDYFAEMTANSLTISNRDGSSYVCIDNSEDVGTGIRLEDSTNHWMSIQAGGIYTKSTLVLEGESGMLIYGNNFIYTYTDTMNVYGAFTANSVETVAGVDLDTLNSNVYNHETQIRSLDTRLSKLRIPYYTLIPHTTLTTTTAIYTTYDYRKISDYDWIVLMMLYASNDIRQTLIVPAAIFCDASRQFTLDCNSGTSGATFNQIVVKYYDDTSISAVLGEGSSIKCLQIYGLKIE